MLAFRAIEAEPAWILALGDFRAPVQQTYPQLAGTTESGAQR